MLTTTHNAKVNLTIQACTTPPWPAEQNILPLEHLSSFDEIIEQILICLEQLIQYYRMFV